MVVVRVTLGVVLKKKCGNARKKLAIFNTTSISFFNQFLMMYSLFFQYKEKHEKSLGTRSRPTKPLGWQSSKVAVVLDGNCPGGSCPGWQLSWVAIVLVAIVVDGNCPRWQLSCVAIFLGGSCPRWQSYGWQLSKVAVVLSGGYSGGSCPDTMQLINVNAIVSRVWKCLDFMLLNAIKCHCGSIFVHYLH